MTGKDFCLTHICINGIYCICWSLFLLVHLSGLCELHGTGTIASLLTNCIYVMKSVHTAKVMIAEVLLQLLLFDASYNLDHFFSGLLCYACQIHFKQEFPEVLFNGTFERLLSKHLQCQIIKRGLVYMLFLRVDI